MIYPGHLKQLPQLPPSGGSTARTLLIPVLLIQGCLMHEWKLFGGPKIDKCPRDMVARLKVVGVQLVGGPPTCRLSVVNRATVSEIPS